MLTSYTEMQISFIQQDLAGRDHSSKTTTNWLADFNVIV